MRSKPIVAHATALAAVAGTLIAGGSAVAQMRGGYSSVPNTVPTTSQSTTYNMHSQEAQPVSQVKDPAATLASARVQDSSGQTVGQVKSVSTTADGKATIVNVSLTTSGGAGKVVSIDANGLRYDSDSRTPKASLTQSEISSLPPMQSP